MFNLKSCRSFFYVHVLFCVSFLRNIKRKGNSLFQFDGRVHKICDGVGLNLLSSTRTLYENMYWRYCRQYEHFIWNAQFSIKPTRACYLIDWDRLFFFSMHERIYVASFSVFHGISSFFLTEGELRSKVINFL